MLLAAGLACSSPQKALDSTRVDLRDASEADSIGS